MHRFSPWYSSFLYQLQLASLDVATINAEKVEKKQIPNTLVMNTVEHKMYASVYI